MADYQPMSREIHLARGSCCDSLPHCVFCPFQSLVVHRPTIVDERIEAALRSGETITLYINRTSLVPSLTLLDRVTLIYKTQDEDNN